MTRSPVAVLRRTVLVGTSALTVAAALGCHKPPFPENRPRTQFETYDRMRQQVTPLKEPDVFGSPKPAVRARLSTGSN